MPRKSPRINKMELGVTGLRQTGGVIREEYLPELRGRKKFRAFEEMRHNSPVIGGILHATSAILRGTSIAVEERGSGQQSTKARDLYESAFYDLSTSWEDTHSEIVEGEIVHGWTYHELVYKTRGGWVEDGSKRSIYDDGMLAWRKLPVRSQDSLVRWMFDEEGGIAGMEQSDPNGRRGIIQIPIEKALLFRIGASRGNPEGRSLLRPCYEPRYFEREIQRIEAIGVERELNGIPFAEVPPEIMHADAAADEKALYQDIKDLVTNLRADEMAGVVFPMAYDEEGRPLFKFSLLSTGGRRAIDTEAVIARYQTRQGMALLASFLFLGMTSVGAKAVADPQIDLFKESLQCILNGNLDVFNTHALPRLMTLNGFSLRGAEWPEAISGKVNAPTMPELADYVNKLVGVEAIHVDDAIEDRLREVAHLPEREGAEVRKTRKRFGWRAHQDVGQRIAKVAPEDYPLIDTFPDGTRQRNYEEAYGDTLAVFGSQRGDVVAAVGAVKITDAAGAAEQVLRAQFEQWQAYMATQIAERAQECAVATYGQIGVSPDWERWQALMAEAARDAAAELAGHITDTTIRNIKAEIAIGRSQGADPAALAKRIDTYYRYESGPHRSDLIARDIASVACSLGKRIAAKATGKSLWKKWTATMDGRTRYTHAKANGQVRPFDDPYDIGGEALEYPGDSSASFENRFGCRCVESYGEYDVSV